MVDHTFVYTGAVQKIGEIIAPAISAMSTTMTARG